MFGDMNPRAFLARPPGLMRRATLTAGPGPTAGTISGIVKDSAGAPVAGRVVRAYRRDTGAPLGQAITSEWSPSQLTVPPKLWLDDSTAVTDVSGAASQWNDKSGNGWHATQSTAGLRPAITASAVNGRRALTFSSDLMTVAAGSYAILNNVSAVWSLLVFSQDLPAQSGYRSLLSMNGGTDFSTSNTGRFRAVQNSGVPGVRSRRIQSETLTNITASSSTSGWAVGLYIANHAAGTGALIVDGGTPITGSLTSSANTPASSLAEFVIGDASTSTTSESYAGKIAAVIAGSGSLPDSNEIDKLFGWAAWRFGLQANLPEEHPYKSTPPVTSSSDGAYTIDTGGYTGEVNVICLDDDAAPIENDLIARAYPS